MPRNAIGLRRGKNAADYGVLPGGAPDDNRHNLQALLDRGGDVVVDEPGVYGLDGMLVIHGGTALRFGRGVVLKRESNEGGVLINRGALTGETDRDILIEGLRLCCNGFSGTVGDVVPGMHGQLNFYRVKDLIVRDVVCDDLPSASYFLHLSNWENVLVDTISVTGLKDGVHANRGEHLRVVNGRFRTYDDPIALNAHDYPTGCPELGWIRDVVIEHCVDLDADNTTGFFARVLGGAWSDWKKGNAYRHSDAAVASNGYVYRCIAQRDLREYVSEEEPCHDAGDRTYADGVTWRCIQHDTAYSCGCENVVFRDIMLEKKRPVALSIHYDNDKYSRSCYPGAVAVPQKNILLDRVVCSVPLKILVHVKTPVDSVRVVNSSVNANVIVNLSDPLYEEAAGNRLTRVGLANNAVALPEGVGSVTAVRACPGRRAMLRMNGILPEGDFPIAMEGDVKTEA